MEFIKTIEQQSNCNLSIYAVEEPDTRVWNSIKMNSPLEESGLFKGINCMLMRYMQFVWTFIRRNLTRFHLYIAISETKIRFTFWGCANDTECFQRFCDMSDCSLPNQLKFIVPTAGRLPSSMIRWTVFLLYVYHCHITVLCALINQMKKLETVVCDDCKKIITSQWVKS